MNILITYSSKTNNTKVMAEAIYREIKEDFDVDICEIGNINRDVSYDGVLIGGYNDKSILDKISLGFLENIDNNNVGIFATAGAGPDTKQGQKFISYMKDLIKDKNSLGVYLLPGKVSKKLERAIKIAPSSLIGLIRSDLKKDATSKEVKKSLLEFIDNSRNASDKELKDAGKYFYNNIKTLSK